MVPMLCPGQFAPIALEVALEVALKMPALKHH